MFHVLFWVHIYNAWMLPSFYVLFEPFVSQALPIPQYHTIVSLLAIPHIVCLVYKERCLNYL